MHRFHIRSIVLGVGIGIILTAIISMIYLAGTHTGMTREEIIEKAKEYGMVEKSFIHDEEQVDSMVQPTADSEGTQQNDQPDESTQVNADTKAAEPEPPEQEPVKIEPPKVKIVIAPGSTTKIVAQTLSEAGLISDKEGFIKKMQHLKLTTSVKSGEYIIPGDADFDTIVRIITKSR